jgi:drug/metabolite transporter (DMT)-like permease
MSSERSEHAPIGNQPLKGAGALLLASVLFSSLDITASILNRSIPALQTTWFRYLFFALTMAALYLMRKGGPRPVRRPGLQILRGLCVSCSGTLFILSLDSLPLAVATSLHFIAPLLIVALSALVLGERVDRVRWLAVAAGFIGVLLIIRPGFSAFSWATLLPLCAAGFWSCGMVLTRRIGADDDVIVTVTCTALIGLVGLSCLQPFVWKPPPLSIALVGALTGFVAVGAQLATASAYRWANASLVAPLAYSQLIWAMLFDIFVLKHNPDALTIIGAGVIIASGLAIVYAGRRT